jgi:hypothetical protein
MKITKEQLKRIIKEELEIVLEAEEMASDHPDWETVASAIMDVLGKLPGGQSHTKMMMAMGMDLSGEIHAVVNDAVKQYGIPQQADYVYEKVIEKLR